MIPASTEELDSKGCEGKFYQSPHRDLSIKGTASASEHVELSRNITLALSGRERILPDDFKEAVRFPKGGFRVEIRGFGSSPQG